MSKSTQKSRVLDMTDGNIARLLLSFAFPIFVGCVLQQVYNLADTAIAGHLLGDDALAQIGATAALYSLITSFCIGLTNGLSLPVSRCFGSGKMDEMRTSACWMIILSFAVAVIMTAGFLIFRYPLLRVLQTPEDTFAGAMSYITVILAGIPLTMIYNTESGLLRAIGNSITPLIFLIVSSVINVILDVLFMGPLHFGVQGAATATILAQAISVILCFFYILKNYPQLHMKREDLHVSSGFVMEMFVTGMSMALMNAVFSIGSVILQSSINALGNVYIAAQVGGRRLAELFMMPGTALSTSTATFSSQNYGAGRRSRIWGGVKVAFGLYLIWWLIAVAFSIFIAPYAVRLITGSSNPTVIGNALLYVRISTAMFPPMSFLVIMRNALQGMHHQLSPLLCSVLELIGKVIFAFWIVPVKGYIAVCICEPVTWVICFVFIAGAALIFRNDFKDKAEASLH